MYYPYHVCVKTKHNDADVELGFMLALQRPKYDNNNEDLGLWYAAVRDLIKSGLSTDGIDAPFSITSLTRLD